MSNSEDKPEIVTIMIIAEGKMHTYECDPDNLNLHSGRDPETGETYINFHGPTEYMVSTCN